MDLIILVADYVYKAIDALPVTAHPMTQFASGVMALQVSKLTFSNTFNFLYVHILAFLVEFENLNRLNVQPLILTYYLGQFNPMES